MQPLFSNALSKAVENHIKLSDTRRETLAWLALLIMRARHDLLVAVGGSWREPGANGFRAAASHDFSSASNWTARQLRAWSPIFWDLAANLAFWPWIGRTGSSVKRQSTS